MKKIGLLFFLNLAYAGEAELRLELWQLWQEGEIDNSQYYEILSYSEQPRLACKLLSFYSTSQINSCTGGEQKRNWSLDYQRSLNLDSSEAFAQKAQVQFKNKFSQGQIAWDLDSNRLARHNLGLQYQNWSFWLGEELGAAEYSGVDYSPRKLKDLNNPKYWYWGRSGQLNGAALARKFSWGHAYVLGSWNHQIGDTSLLDSRLWIGSLQISNWNFSIREEQANQRENLALISRWQEKSREAILQLQPGQTSAAFDFNWDIKDSSFQSLSQLHAQSANYTSFYEAIWTGSPTDTLIEGISQSQDASVRLAQKMLNRQNWWNWKIAQNLIFSSQNLLWTGQGEIANSQPLQGFAQLQWKNSLDTASSNLGLRLKWSMHRFEIKQRAWQQKSNSSELHYPLAMHYQLNSGTYALMLYLQIPEFLWKDRQSSLGLSHSVKLPSGAEFRSNFNFKLGGLSQIHQPKAALDFQLHF